MGLHNKFTLLAVTLTTVLTAFFSWMFFDASRARIVANQADKVDLLSEIVNNGLKTSMLEGRGKDFQIFLNNLIAEDIAAVRIYSPKGTILISSMPGEVGRNIAGKQGPVRHAGGAEKREIYSRSILIKNDWPCQRCHGNKEVINGILDVEVFTRDAEQKIAASATKAVIYFFLTVISLSLSMRALSLYQVKHPIDRIISSLRGASGMKPPVSGRQGDEMRLLEENLKALLTDLDRSREEIGKCIVDKNMYIERMASLGELAAAVAHDIKNPLAGISGALQVLAEDFPTDSPRKEIAVEILKEIGRLDAAVKDLLFYARPPELNLILTDINAIIDKVRELVVPRAAELNVKINSISDNISETIADPEQLGRAVQNIAFYCLQSMQGGGTLTFATFDRHASGEIEIAVSDTGGGSRGNDPADVFKPSFSTKHSGTGLGLAISRNIVERHRGRIEVESLVGVGCTFRMFLKQKG